MLELLGNKYVIAIGIPFVFLLCGGIAKTIIADGALKKENFDLGIEGILASISSSLLYLTEIAQRTERSGVGAATVNSELVKIVGTSVFLAALILFLLVLILFHRRRGKPSASWVSSLVSWVVSNTIGLGSLAVFIIWVKGV